VQFEWSVPAIRDRVVQMAAVLILEPIFQADLQDEQYAYRAKRDAHDAVRKCGPKTQNFGYCFNFNMLLPITRGNALRGQSFENGLGVFAGCFVSTSGRARNAPPAG
jgi:hypothetical protein